MIFSRSKAKDLLAARRHIANLEATIRDMDDLRRKPHFVQDYTALVRHLLAEHPIDEAMSIAAGGDYENAGRSLVGVLQACGLRDGMSVVDLGCGNGRVAHQLGILHPGIQYLGLDLVPEMPEYAATKCPAHFGSRLIMISVFRWKTILLI